MEYNFTITVKAITANSGRVTLRRGALPSTSIDYSPEDECTREEAIADLLATITDLTQPVSK